MHGCYHPEVHFSDPVFQNLKGGQAKAMWHMLLEAGKDLEITFSDIKADDSRGQCKLDAHYTFSRTKRRVHNVISAEFQFQDGLIIRHADTFDLWRWSGMALGTVGKLLGWTPMIKGRIRKTASSSLAKFLASHPEYNPG